MPAIEQGPAPGAGFLQRAVPGAGGAVLQTLQRAERTAPLRYRVIVIPGSGCAGMGPIAERYFAGLLHAQVLVLHKPGYGLSHMTPARRPADGFAEHWENPYTHAQMDAGPEALCGESARLAAGYLKAAAAYWEGRSTKEALAAAVGDRSYSTGLLSEPAPAGV